MYQISICLKSVWKLSALIYNIVQLVVHSRSILLSFKLYIYYYYFQFLDALLADLQSTIQQSNKINGGVSGGVNGGYGVINGVRSRLPSADSPVQPPAEYATVRTHKIERSTSNPAVRQELSVDIIISSRYFLIYHHLGRVYELHVFLKMRGAGEGVRFKAVVHFHTRLLGMRNYRNCIILSLPSIYSQLSEISVL